MLEQKQFGLDHGKTTIRYQFNDLEVFGLNKYSCSERRAHSFYTSEHTSHLVGQLQGFS